MRTWRVLVIDDDKGHRESARDAIVAIRHTGAANGLSVELEDDFDRGEKRIKTERFDIVILDIRKDEDPEHKETVGADLFTRIKGDFFLPVIFYSAVPHHASPHKSLFVAVVDKAEGVNGLKAALGALLDTRLLALQDHLDRTQKELLWSKLPEFITGAGQGGPPTEACGVLARTLARDLRSNEVRKLLGLNETTLHPVECYVVPASAPHPMTGDLYSVSQNNGQSSEYWVVLNPACDLVETEGRPPKIVSVLMAKCNNASDHPELIAWKQKVASNASVDKKAKAEEKATFVLTNREPHSHLLPGFHCVPDLLVSFRDLKLVPYEDLKTDHWKRIASIDSPFAESLNSRFVQYFGRIGVPDIDLTVVKSRLQPQPVPGP